MLTPEINELIATASSWMLTYLIHSTILVLAVWLICRGIRPVARRVSPSTANLGWKLALVGGFVTATVQIAVGVTPALGALELETGPKVVEAPQPQSSSSRQVIRARSGQQIVIRDHEDAEPLMLGLGAVPSAGLGPVGPSPRETAAVLVEQSPAPLWPKLLLLVWMLGAGVALLRLVASVRSLRRRLKDRSEVIVDPVLESFLTLCRDAEVRRKIRLTQSTRIASPIALWRKEIVVPQRAVDELSPAAMRSVLAHELAHLERRDPHWLAFAAVLEALLFIQPLNRLARRGMQESAELLCDDWAIAHTGDGVQFAKSLAELATWTNANRSSLLLAGMISGERPLVRRVRRALEGDPQRFEPNDGARPTRLLVGLGALSALIMIAPVAVGASPPEKAATTKDDAKETRAERRVRKAQERAVRDAVKAEARALEARQKAEQAQREAEQAVRSAQQAAQDAHLHRDQPHPRGGKYLIIDGRGVHMHSDEADIVITDGEKPRMRLRVHEDDINIDIDIDVDSLTGMVDALAGEFLGGGMPQGFGPQYFGPQGFGAQEFTVGSGFDLEDLAELEELADQWGAWGEAMGERFEERFEREHFEREREHFEREFDGSSRELERELREVEQRARELERELREREQQQRSGAAPRAPRAPARPSSPPVAPAAPTIPA